VIGDTGAISTLGNFNTINWKLSPKFLKIEMDPAAGNNFITIGTTQFQYVAYAQFAKSVDAENIVGILPVSKGGTGLSTIAELKSALALDKINNTADADKPISTKTQTALDLILVTASDTTRFSNRINLKANTTDVNLITTTLGTKLNTADTIKFTKQTYSDSSLLTKLKIADTSAMLSSRIARDTLSLSNRINLKGNAADLTSGLALKEDATNKSTATDLGGVSPSDVLFPTQKAVKEYVAANAGSGGVADGGITNIKLADGAVTYAKFQTIPTNTILGNTSSSTTSVQAIATTGLDNVVLSTSPTITSPTLITPNIGAATATSINDVIINGFNFKSDLPSITITGTTTLQGNNTGDDATNSKYEGLLTNGGAVDLINDQAIDGKKTFLNNITMANLLGAGSITPTTINFANGSKIGDIQNINGDDPDVAGSIDLFAPYGAKRVQINYGDSNYMRLSQDSAGIGIGNMHWKFNKDGSTELPLRLAVTSDILIGKGYLDYPGESFFDTARIGSPTNVKIMVMNEDNVGDFWNWKFNKDGNTILPGNLTFEEDNDPSIISDYSLDIQSKDFLRVQYRNDDFFTSLKLADGQASLLVEDITGSVNKSWYYRVDGSSWFPGDLQVGKVDGNTKPSTINFENGSKLGDIQNIDEEDPDAYGSIDLFAPDGAKWVQMNYGNSNYIWIDSTNAFIDIGEKRWRFKKDGSTLMPGNLVIGTDLTDTAKISSLANINIQVRNDDSENDYWNWKFNKYGNTILPGNLTFEEDNNPGIISDYSLNIISKDNLRLAHSNDDFYTSLKLGDGSARLSIENENGDVSKIWNYEIDGSSWFPGDLNFTDNHAINFTSTGTSTTTTNASITSEEGPYLKLATRAASGDELSEDVYNGVELNYADLSRLTVDHGGINFLTFDDQNPNIWSGVTFDSDKFSFYKLNNSKQYDWIFNGLDASTTLPGALLLTVNIETAGTLKLGSTIFSKEPRTNGYVLTYNNGNAVWQASTGTSVSDNIDASTLSGTTLNSTITGSSLTSVGTLANLTVTDAIVGSIIGNAATATTAITAGNITATSNNTLTTLSSLTSVGVLNSATVNGKVIIGATSEVSVSAVLEASSTTQGFLPPRMTITQRSVIASPAQGLMIYCTNCGTYGEPQYYNGAAWLNFAGNASAKAIPIVTPTIGTYTYTGSAQGPSEATNTGTGTTYTYSYSGTVSTTYSSSATKPIEVGDYAVIASVSADGNYEAASSSATAFRILNILSVGDDYQGGKIAYILVDGDPGYDATTPHGLIAATEDQGSEVRWYNGSYTTTGATGTIIGTGLSNTNTIITSQGPTSTNYAAGLARAYTGGGFTDWYLPSINELGKLYLNRVLIGGFIFKDNTNYWSSTEESVFFSFYFDFSNGVPTYSLKNDIYRVRAIRAF
jgi:hypothetical protein